MRVTELVSRLNALSSEEKKRAIDEIKLLIAFSGSSKSLREAQGSSQ